MPTPAHVFLLGLVLAQVGDAVTFTLGVSIYGIRVESNAFAMALFGWSGLAGVLAAKGAAIVISLALLCAAAGRWPRLLVWGSATATSLGLVGLVANGLSLLILS